MPKSSLGFFCGFIILIYYFRLAESQDERSSVCLLENAPVQCGAFCSSLLFPVYNHNRIIQRKLEETQKKLDRLDQLDRLERMEEKLLEIQKALAGIGSQEAKVLEKVTINSRLFFIEKHTLADWDTSENACRRMGGHLATFQNREEFDHVNAKLDPKEFYWLGIYKEDYNGILRSVSNGNPVKFLKFNGYLITYCEEFRCSFLIKDGEMFISHPNARAHYICQADEL